MTKAFWQSKVAYVTVILISVALGIVIWIRDVNYPTIVPLIASSFLVTIGFVSAKILSSVIANHLNTKLLSILHVELDPKQFATKYEPVVRKLNINKNREARFAYSYLADGYALCGNYGKAIETIENLKPFIDRDIALRGLYYTNTASYLTMAGEYQKAQEALSELRHVVEDTRQGKKALSCNLETSAKIIKNRIASLSGRGAKTSSLLEQLEKATYRIRRLEILEALAKDADFRQKPEKAEEYKAMLKEEAGNTIYKNRF